MTNTDLSQLALTYADMSDDELAELNMRRGSLTPQALWVFDAETSRRRENIPALTEEKLEEDFRAIARRWNDDDLLFFLRNNPVPSPAQQRVLHEETHRRDLDLRTLPPDDGLAIAASDPDATVVIARFDSEGEAAVVQSLLASFGIPAAVRPGGLRPRGTWLGKSGVPVTTTGRYLRAAREVLASGGAPALEASHAVTLDAQENTDA